MADADVKGYRYTMPREIDDGALVAAMYPPGVEAAYRTRCAQSAVELR